MRFDGISFYNATANTAKHILHRDWTTCETVFVKWIQGLGLNTINDLNMDQTTHHESYDQKKGTPNSDIGICPICVSNWTLAKSRLFNIHYIQRFCLQLCTVLGNMIVAFYVNRWISSQRVSNSYFFYGFYMLLAPTSCGTNSRVAGCLRRNDAYVKSL